MGGGYVINGATPSTLVCGALPKFAYKIKYIWLTMVSVMSLRGCLLVSVVELSCGESANNETNLSSLSYKVWFLKFFGMSFLTAITCFVNSSIPQIITGFKNVLKGEH